MVSASVYSWSVNLEDTSWPFLSAGVSLTFEVGGFSW